MKLVFPGGEHPQVLLGPGVNRIGSGPRANIVLDRPGVLPQHCQLHVTPSGVMLDVPHGTSVTVNGRRVDGLIALRPGDSVAFDGVEARLSSMESAAAVPHQVGVAGRMPESANDDPGATAVRPVLPRYVLRGVSGEAFGRTYPMSFRHVSTSLGFTNEALPPALHRHGSRAAPTFGGKPSSRSQPA